MAPVTPAPHLDPQALLTALVASSDDAIIATSLDGIILSWNPAAERHYGYAASEVLGHHIALIVPPERHAELTRILERLAQGERIERLETVHRHRDGSRLAVEPTISPIHDAAGQVIGASTIARDARARLTEDAERSDRLAAQSAEARLRALLEAAPDAIVIADAAGRITFFNAQTEALFGYGRAELLGQPVERLVPDRFHAVHEGHRTGFARAPSVRYMGAGLELSGRRRDGSEFPVEISLSPVEVDGAVSVISAIRDISARKQADAALHRAVAEAERANLAKSEFLSRMSHELRTPLNAVLGFGQLLALDPLDAQQQTNVGHILKAGRHLLDLINEVLDIARIEAGRLTMSLEPVQLGDVVRAALDLARPLAAEHAIDLDDAALLGTSGDHFVLADRQRLTQVLLNLLSNAIKYNQHAGTVTLHCETVGSRVRLGVQDRGPGIAPEKLDQLFEPFERLGAETTEVEGTGLGLALTKGLVEAMHGTITVESRVGVGSAFSVELPLSMAPGATPAGSDEANRTGPQLATGHRRRTVLYIEDNLPNLELIEQLLARWSDVAVLSAMQGRHGVELALQHQPDLILLDVHLPDIEGTVVLQLLQEEARTRDIPVVVVSADATERQVTRLLAAGARAYLTKPIDVAHFLRVVRELLETSPG